MKEPWRLLSRYAAFFLRPLRSELGRGLTAAARQRNSQCYRHCADRSLHLDETASSDLTNISTRGFVQGGEHVLIGGFILGNKNGGSRIVVRAIGPSLSEFGVA